MTTSMVALGPRSKEQIQGGSCGRKHEEGGLVYERRPPSDLEQQRSETDLGRAHSCWLEPKSWGRGEKKKRYREAACS